MAYKNNEQNKVYKDMQQLLEAIYEGSNRANKSKRNIDTQKANFPEGKVRISSDLDLLEKCTLLSTVAGFATEFSILSHAIEAYNKPALKCLLEHALFLANFYIDEEPHPLYRAAKLNSREMVKILLSKGADPTQNVYKEIGRPVLMELRLNNGFYLPGDVYANVKNDDGISKDIKTSIRNRYTEVLQSRAIENSRSYGAEYRDTGGMHDELLLSQPHKK